jgi:signal transduction histidine kinase/putative methionine-R-sulfoxide reductase with GAF domain
MSLATRWNRFIAAHPSITNVEHSRQSRLLNMFLLSLTGLLIGIVVAETVRIVQNQSTPASLVPYFAALLVFTFTLVLNKRGYYLLAAYTFVIAGFLVFPVDYFFDDYSAGSLIYFVPVFIVSALFLSLRSSLLVLLASIVTIIIAVSIHGPRPNALSMNFLVQFPLICGTLVLIFVRFRNGLERARQRELAQANDALRLTEASLEKRIGERTRDLELAAGIATQIASFLYLDQLLGEIVERTKTTFNLYHVSLHLYDEATDLLSLEVATGDIGRALVKAQYKIHVPTAKGMIPEAARRRTAVNSGDVRQTSFFIPHPLLAQTRSELSLPMIAGERLIGVLDCQSEQLNRFGPDDIRMMTTLSEQIAVAVENAQLFDATENAQRRLAIIAEINQQIMRATDEYGILASLAWVGCDAVSLYYVHSGINNEPQDVELVAAINKEGRPLTTAHNQNNGPVVYQRAMFPFVQAMIDNNLVGTFIEDVDSDPRLDNTSRGLMESLGAKTVVVLPLKSRNTWQAMIILRWETLHHIDAEQRTLFSELLPRIADNVATRRAFLDAQTARRESEQLFQVSRALNQVQSYETIVESITAHLSDAGFSVTLIAYEGFNSETATYCDVLAQHVAPKMGSATDLRFDANLLKMWTSREVIFAPDITQVPGLPPQVIEGYRRDNVRAMALMGLVLGSRTLGALILTRIDAREFTIPERNYFRAMADLAAAAVERTRLYIDQVQTADQLRAVDQMKSQFLASMSHELRTPLNAILNFTEFVAIGMLGTVNDSQHDALNKSLESGRHLLSLINDVLDITKMEAGMMTLFIEDNVNLITELNPVITATETLLKDKSVAFIQDIAADLPLMVGDKRRIRQILLNLLSNAAKFTDEGQITLHVQQQAEEILFSVADTGPGIALEDQTVIFEPFIQTEVGIKHAGGTGLGLPISKRLAEAHGGRLWVESEAGQGATFFVSLPIRSNTLLKMLSVSEDKLQAALAKPAVN